MRIISTEAESEYRAAFVVTFPDTGKSALFFNEEPDELTMEELRKQSRFPNSIYARPCLMAEIEEILVNGKMVKVERNHWKLTPST